MGQKGELMDFCGKHVCSLDSKGRFFLPAKFRRFLDDKRIFLTMGFDKCLNLYRIEDWKEFENKLLGLPINKPEVRKVQRYFIGLGESIEVDTKGRIKIPSGMIEFVGIKGQLIALGQGNRVELWSPENLKPVEDDMYVNIEKYFEKLEI